MTAHVAEAGENRGRVLLRFTSCHPSPVALDAAIRIARAFEAEVENLFVEDDELLQCASFPFASEISFSGRARRRLSPETLEREMQYACQAVQRRMETLARAAEVPLKTKIVREEPLSALAAACAENGPWNIVALGEPFSSHQGDELRRIFEHVTDTTGLVLVGPNARRTSGPIVAVIEDESHVGSMLRTARRLAESAGQPVIALLVAASDTLTDWLEQQARLALEGETPSHAVTLLPVLVPHGSSAALAEVIRCQHGGFVIGRWGGLLVPVDDLSPLAAALECPLLLVR